MDSACRAMQLAHTRHARLRGAAFELDSTLRKAACKSAYFIVAVQGVLIAIHCIQLLACGEIARRVECDLQSEQGNEANSNQGEQANATKVRAGRGRGRTGAGGDAYRCGLSRQVQSRNSPRGDHVLRFVPADKHAVCRVPRRRLVDAGNRVPSMCQMHLTRSDYFSLIDEHRVPACGLFWSSFPLPSVESKALPSLCVGRESPSLTEPFTIASAYVCLLNGEFGMAAEVFFDARDHLIYSSTDSRRTALCKAAATKRREKRCSWEVILTRGRLSSHARVRDGRVFVAHRFSAHGALWRLRTSLRRLYPYTRAGGTHETPGPANVVD